MAWGSDETQPETFEIVERITERVDFKLAAVAGTGIDRADGKAAAKLAPGGTVNARRQFRKRGIVGRPRPFG